MHEQVIKILNSVKDTEISVAQGFMCLRELKEKNPTMLVATLKEITGNEYKDVMFKLAKEALKSNGTNSTGPR